MKIKGENFDLTGFDINIIFDLKDCSIKLYFNTDLEYPLNQVFVKLDKNDKKVENITLNDFIENSKEVLSLIKLFLY